MWKLRDLLRLGSPLTIKHILGRWETLVYHRNTWTGLKEAIISTFMGIGSMLGGRGGSHWDCTDSPGKLDICPWYSISLPLPINQERVGSSCYLPSALLFDMWLHCCHRLPFHSPHLALSLTYAKVWRWASGIAEVRTLW